MKRYRTRQSNGSTQPKALIFVELNDGSKDAFVHITAVQQAGLITLKEGQQASDELVEAVSGRTAVQDISLVSWPVRRPFSRYAKACSIGKRYVAPLKMWGTLLSVERV